MSKDPVEIMVGPEGEANRRERRDSRIRHVSLLAAIILDPTMTAKESVQLAGEVLMESARAVKR